MQKARRLEVEYLNQMTVVERVPNSFTKHRNGKEPIKVRLVDTLKNSGIHKSKLVTKEFRRGSKIDGLMNFSATLPLELVKLMISMVATAQWDQTAWFGQEGHESSSDIVMMHTDIRRAYFHAPCKEEKNDELPPEIPSMGGSECRCTSLVTHPQIGRMRTPKYYGNSSWLRVHVHSAQV